MGTSSELEKVEAAEARDHERHSNQSHQVERAQEHAHFAEVFRPLGRRHRLAMLCVPGVKIGRVDAAERPVLADLHGGADQKRQNAEDREAEIADNGESNDGREHGKGRREQGEGVFRKRRVSGAPVAQDPCVSSADGDRA